MRKLEYRVAASNRRYSWDAPFYFVERRTPGGTWSTIPGLTKQEREEISYSYQRKYDAEAAIATAKRIERKHLKWDRKRVEITVAFPAIEDGKQFLYVRENRGWWSKYDTLKVRLMIYKDVKDFVRKNPFFAESETAVLDGAYNVVEHSKKGLTADISRPFLLKAVTA